MNNPKDDLKLEGIPSFPNIIPSRIKEILSHEFETDYIESEEDFHDLIMMMFHYSEREYYLYEEKDGPRNQILHAKEKLGVIVFEEIEFFYYRCPGDRGFIHIERNTNHEREKKIVDQGPMYMRTKLKLSERIKREFEIRQKIEMEDAFRKERQAIAQTRDRELMLRAIELARKCVSEAGKISPKVGAVVARDGVFLGEAYRGELKSGEHAEYTLLERKLPHEALAGTTLYTTLEPCTSRNHPKIPCAEWIVDRRIKKVVIGALDKNPKIQGNGVAYLQEHGIEIALFDSDLHDKLFELNRDFIRQYKKGRKRRSKTETKDPVAPDTVGPNGFKIGYTENGDKVEWIPDDENPGEFWPMILRRNDDDIITEYNELWDKVWYIRKIIMFEKMDDEPYREKERPGYEDTLEAMKKIEQKYGKENLGWDDVEWGIIQGKMAALAWVMGSEWEGSMDT